MYVGRGLGMLLLLYAIISPALLHRCFQVSIPFDTSIPTRLIIFWKMVFTLVPLVFSLSKHVGVSPTYSNCRALEPLIRMHLKCANTGV